MKDFTKAEAPSYAVQALPEAFTLKFLTIIEIINICRVGNGLPPLDESTDWEQLSWEDVGC